MEQQAQNTDQQETAMVEQPKSSVKKQPAKKLKALFKSQSFLMTAATFAVCTGASVAAFMVPPMFGLPALLGVGALIPVVCLVAEITRQVERRAPGKLTLDTDVGMQQGMMLGLCCGAIVALFCVGGPAKGPQPAKPVAPPTPAVQIVHHARPR